MQLDNFRKEKISIEVIKVLLSRFSSFPDDNTTNRNAPFHEAFLNAFTDQFENKVSDIPFFISLASWAHGLSTTLGQNFFEKIAHHLSNGDKREYTSGKNGNLQVTNTQANYANDLISKLSNRTISPNLQEENSSLYSIDDSGLILARNFSADIYFEDTENITCIELKSVKPNAGEMMGEKQKIIFGKAALKVLNPDKNINFFIGFPFDPTVDVSKESITSSNKERFLDSIIDIKKYFHNDEVLLADELWDCLSGQKNTMQQILDIINSIATPEFLVLFEYLNTNSNRNNSDYIEKLRNWNLFSEIELIENNSTLKKILEKQKTENRIYNKTMFENNGDYKFNRYYILKELLKQNGKQ